ncbi:MAG: YncE family protein [Steroidobacteraceae bacterium]
MSILESRKAARSARVGSGYHESGGSPLEAIKRAKLLLLLAMALGTLGLGSHAVAQQTLTYTTHILALPSHGQGNVTMDYITYDPKTGYVWVPAINIGSVFVIDTGNEQVHEIAGFATKKIEVRGRKGVQGPSAVSVGDGVVYIGDRADRSICAVDEKTLARRNCGHIDSTPDGVVYVAPTDEVWVTSPGDDSVRILDSRSLQQKAKLTFDGRPEGYAVDTRRDRLYMNYEDKDLTTAIDLKTRKTVAKWRASCGPDGPHGLQIDQNTGYLFVACSTRAEVLNAGGNGQRLSSINTGDGVDDLNYSPSTHMLYVGAAEDGQLSVARVDGAGKLRVVAVVPTHEGERNGVVTKNGTVYMAHARPGNFTAMVVAVPNGK